MSTESANSFDESKIELLDNWEEPPLLMVVSAPSGAGKSTICRRILQNATTQGDCNRGLEFSISTTTRSPRYDEVDGQDYHFVDRDTFDEMVEDDAFLEWAQVHDEYYGTSKKSVENALDNGDDILLEIDVQGAKQVKACSYNTVLIFVAPPSLEELERRLRDRDTETEEQIKKRLSDARKEFQEIEHYDYVVINDRINRAVSKIESIRLAEKCKSTHQATISGQSLPRS
ncbi:MAG: guanylate kinase [bacterium]